MNTIRDAIQNLTATGNEPYAKVCRVVSVDTATRTLHVEPLDGTTPIYDAALQAGEASDGLVSFPVVGSLVLVVLTDKHNAVVCNVSQPGRFQFSQNGLVFDLDSDSGLVELGNDHTSLKQLLTDLTKLLLGLKVNTAVGPSVGLLPDTVAALNKFETDFKKLLK